MPGGFFPWRRKPAPGPPVSPPKASSRVAPSEELSQLQAQLKVAQAGRRQVRQELDTLTRAKRESEQALAGSQQKVTGLQAEVERLTDVTRASNRSWRPVMPPSSSTPPECRSWKA